MYIWKFKEKCHKDGTYVHKSGYCTKGKEKITVRTTRSMVTSMNNVSARTSTSKNTHTITISVTNIRSDGINKTFTNRKKRKRKVKEK